MFRRVIGVLRAGIHLIAVVIVSSAPLAVLAADAPTPDLIRDNAALFAWILGMALAALGVIIVWYIKCGNENNEKQWSSINNHERRLSRLEGEHGVNHGRRASDHD